MTAQRDTFAALSRGLEIAAAIVTWVVVLAFTAFETISLMPLVVRYSYSRADAITQCVAYTAMILLWFWCLIGEYLRRHRRRQARFLRRLGFTQQAFLLLVLIWGSVDQKQTGVAIAAGVSFACTMILWFAWIQSFQLPPEDQKIVDALAAEESRLAAEAWAARIEQDQQERLRKALAQVRRYTTAPAVQPESPAAKATPQWDIPSGKHAPMVYFIRNGNRIKIGTTTELRRRIRTLALRQEHVLLLLPGTQPLERALHKRFADLRDGNTEWFQYTGALTQYVTEQNAKILAAGGDEA